MTTAEWGVLLGAIGTVTGTAGLFWRVFEWWRNNRLDVQVVGSAGQVLMSDSGVFVGKGGRFRESEVVVYVINRSRREVTVDAAGFLVERPKRGQPYAMWINPRGLLPAKLSRGERAQVLAGVENLQGAVAAGTRLVPFCRDAEGHVHRGKNDEYFEGWVKRMRESGQ
jgi:hypothetical protein